MAEQVRPGLRAVGGGPGDGSELGSRDGRPGVRFTRADGRKFGLTVGLAFLLLGSLLWWRGHDLIAIFAAGPGIALLLGALTVPARLGPIQRGWMALARAISRVTNPLVMGIIYFLVITPVGWLRRILSRNPLHHPERDQGYWVPRESERGNLERQF